MDKLRSCLFTGHRDITGDEIPAVKDKIINSITKLVEFYDVKNFIAGGALGFDMLAEEAVIEMRRSYPHIKLYIYIPCIGQDSRWSYENKKRYRSILSAADDVVYVSNLPYRRGCMHVRNRRMVNDAFFCIAYCRDMSSGTGYTIQEAQKNGCMVINLIN